MRAGDAHFFCMKKQLNPVFLYEKRTDLLIRLKITLIEI